MDGWWDEIEAEIAAWLERHDGEATVAELAGYLALSESATASLLTVLAPAGAVRIARVTAADARSARSESSSPKVHAGVIAR